MKLVFILLIPVIAVLAVLQGMVLLGFPVWIILAGLPLLAYGQIYALNRYSFRDSLELEAIPEKGFEKQLDSLELDGDELEELGFIRFDEFYLRLSQNVIVYVYHHQTEPIYFCQFVSSALHLSDLVTKFDNGFTLTTANTKNAGNIPRPNHKMLQIFEGRSVAELCQHHMEGIKFLISQGFKPLPSDLNNFRTDFLSSFMEVGREVRGILAPPKLIYWQLSGINKNYCQSVQQQFLAKRLLLPS